MNSDADLLVLAVLGTGLLGIGAGAAVTAVLARILPRWLRAPAVLLAALPPLVVPLVVARWTLSGAAPCPPEHELACGEGVLTVLFGAVWLGLVCAAVLLPIDWIVWGAVGSGGRRAPRPT